MDALPQLISDAIAARDKEEFKKGYEAAALSEDDNFNASPAWRDGWLAWSRDANR